MDRNFFIILEPGCYCSKCGKRVLRDRYNYKKHGELCGGFIEDDNYEPVREQDYGYKLHREGNSLILSICRPHLRLRAGFKDQFSGGEWSVIFQCAFMANSKVIKINKQDIDISLNTWVAMIRAKKLVRIHRGSDLNVIRSVFPVIKDIYNLQMFVHIYRTKGYSYNQIISASRANRLLENKNAIMSKEVIFEEDAFHRQFGFDYRTIPFSWYARKKRYPIHVSLYKNRSNNCLIMKLLIKIASGTIIGFLFSENYVYCLDMPSSIKVKDIMSLHVWYSEESKDKIKIFAKRYPQYNLKEFMAQEPNANVLIPLLAPNYHSLCELSAKAGLVHISSHFVLPQYELDPTLYSNLREVFGLPVDCLKKLDEDMIEIPIINAMRDIWKCNPQFLNFDNFNESMIRFFVDRQNERITGILQMSDKQTLKIIRYLYLCNLNYNFYRDYLDICGQLGIYVDGITPKNLYKAHDRCIAMLKEKQDIVMEKKFDEKLKEESYKRLSSTISDDDISYFEKDAFMIVLPRNVEDLFKESQEMHNCVRTYIPAVANGSTKIVFLRKKEKPESSLGTVEVNSFDQIVQAKAFGNQRLGSEEQKFLIRWSRCKHLRIATRDLEG